MSEKVDSSIQELAARVSDAASYASGISAALFRTPSTALTRRTRQASQTCGTPCWCLPFLHHGPPCCNSDGCGHSDDSCRDVHVRRLHRVASPPRSSRFQSLWWLSFSCCAWRRLETARSGVLSGPLPRRPMQTQIGVCYSFPASLHQRTLRNSSRYRPTRVDVPKACPLCRSCGWALLTQTKQR